MAYDFLSKGEEDNGVYQYMMVGYKLENTLTDNGHVARGVCVTDEEGHLITINERTHIEKREGGAAYTEDDGSTWVEIPEGSTVSMNMWGITPEFFEILKTGFDEFLEKTESTDLKAEYLLPTMIGDLLSDGKLEVKVLQSHDQWFGVTYKEDKESVTAALRGLIEKGVYPSKLF